MFDITERVGLVHRTYPENPEWDAAGGAGTRPRFAQTRSRRGDWRLQRVISYAALRLTPGVDFAGLWGGTTHAEWRGRGLYRALTAYRARLALDAGHPYVRVDTSPDSRPILTRLGLHQVTTTTPCVLDPRGSSRSG